ncbi:MAG: hypothetical protein Q7T55_19870 [Solirubrobacteraceae bacterium]|nr:hypothetical protein [Solirubrobacteraceae bacterium]
MQTTLPTHGAHGPESSLAPQRETEYFEFEGTRYLRYWSAEYDSWRTREALVEHREAAYYDEAGAAA